MRLFAFILSFTLFGGGLYLLQDYFERTKKIAEVSPEYALRSASEILSLLNIIGFVLAFFVAFSVYLLITIRILARKKAEKMTRDIAISRAQFERFYELSPIPYLLIDRNGVIKQPNKAAQRLWQSRGDMPLERANIFSYLEEDEKKAVSIKEKVQRGVPIERQEMHFVFSTGEMRWIMLSIERLDVRGTKNPLALATIVDIHEQKELERIKTEFLSLASHQLRTPLANLKWYIDFLLTRKKEELTPTVSSYLQKIFRRNEDMIDLVNTLLNLSRIEMGRVKVEKEDADIAETLRSVTEELEQNIQGKTQHLTVSIPQKHIMHTDKRLVRIIVQNLLANAIRYTPEGGDIHLFLETEKNATIIKVKDTGVGIPPDEQGKIFSKMYRATNAQKMEANGNGIGLYMCKALAEALEGDITFTSEENVGTTFTVSFPTK
jgi:PAS domain S-box-containing protein